MENQEEQKQNYSKMQSVRNSKDILNPENQSVLYGRW